MEKEKEAKIILEESDIWLKQFLHAQSRQNETSDSFTTVQIQIAGLFLVLVPFGLGVSDSTEGLSPDRLIVAGLVFLSLSLIFGIINIHHKTKFWGETGDINAKVFRKYREARNYDLKLEVVHSYIDGLTSGKEKVSSPSIYWIIQTISLLLGIFGILLSLLLNS